MDVNFEYYKIFYYVARYKNFTKAAQALGSSQPNVTRAMNCLEQQINSTLFVRNNRGIQLHQRGKTVYKGYSGYDTAYGRRRACGQCKSFTWQYFHREVRLRLIYFLIS